MIFCLFLFFFLSFFLILVASTSKVREVSILVIEAWLFITLFNNKKKVWFLNTSHFEATTDQ